MNSDGCSEKPGRSIQRRAPLISTPTTKVSASSAIAIAKPTKATRRTARGVQQRHPEHDRESDWRDHQLALDEVQRRVAEPLGDRRACRHAQHHAKGEQQDERTEAPAVDGPPPAGDRPLVDAGEHHRGLSAADRGPLARTPSLPSPAVG